MDSPSKPATRSMSRTVVSAVVGLLIVIAVAGIVLAGRKASTAPDPVSSSATAVTANPPTVAAASEPVPSVVRFEGASERLPAGASGELARFADAARLGGQQVGLTARFAAGGDREAAMALGRKRVEAVQHALQSNGISASRIQAEMIEMPAGVSAPGAGDRVELTLR